MLYLYQSNLTECLLSGLQQIIEQRLPNMSLLEPEHVLVQNPDMAQWLKMELAERQGIAANLAFPLPSSFLWQIFHSLFGDQLPKESPYSKDKMSWQLFQLLPVMADQSEFGWLQPDLFIQDDAESQLRLFQLCGSIADTFDQYLMYRPDWIASWEQGEGFDQVPVQQQWQPKLWQALAHAIKEQSGCGLHRGRLLQETIAKLNRSESLNLPTLPKRISLFGLSSMPEQMLHLLNGLARHIDIHWFQLNPCQHFWLDIVDERTKAKLAARASYINLDDLEEDSYFLVGNPLLASMGQLGREHLSLMYEQLEGDWQEEFSEYPSEHALHVLQQELLNLHCRGQFESLTPEQLTSDQNKWVFPLDQLTNIRFHSCYSPMREVEVLKDELLHLFEQKTQLTPNDILVMMPDVASYAPFIDAVFSPRPGEPFLPFSINDLSAVQESPLIDSFLHLLGLAESRFQLSEILSLLEMPAIMRRFSINEEELGHIKHWLEETGVRWGRDQTQRQDLGLAAFDANSWAFGLQRMLTGYAMDSEQGLFQGSLPYDEIEGKSAAALGKLMMFVDALDQTRAELETPRTALDWSECCALMLQRFYRAESQEQVSLQRIAQAGEKIVAACQGADYEKLICTPLFKDLLTQNLSLAQSGRRFRAGAINFCTLMPMRNIPFKVVCLLGMNDGAFPRASVPNAFDLMSQKRRRGDRSRRLDDRYLFLEALLSAREQLHISWVGRDIRDDGLLPPSILISELRDYMAEAWLVEDQQHLDATCAGQNLLETVTVTHPLQAFNPAYFQPQAPLSYAKVWAESLNAGHQMKDFSEQPLSVEPQDWVELSQLEAMFTNPCQVFLQRQLGVYFDDVAEQSLDAEPFELNALASWQLKQQAFQQSIHAIKGADFFEQGRHSGLMPVAEAGELLLQNAAESVSSLVTVILQLNPLEQQPKEMRLRLTPELGVLGAVATPMASPWLRYYAKPGRLQPKDLMRAWLRHLVASAVLDDGLPMWAIDNDSAQIFKPIEADAAQQLLHAYLVVYQQGLTQPLPLFLRCGFKLLELREKKLTPTELLAELKKEWQTGFNGITGEGEDPYVHRCYPSLEPSLDPLQTLSEQLIAPLFNGLEQHEVRKKFSVKFKHAELLERLKTMARKGAS